MCGKLFFVSLSRCWMSDTGGNEREKMEKDIKKTKNVAMERCSLRRGRDGK